MHEFGVQLTVHLSLEELDEGLCEGLNPFVHDVVALLRCVFIVQELNVILLTHQDTSTNTKTQVRNLTHLSQSAGKQRKLCSNFVTCATYGQILLPLHFFYSCCGCVCLSTAV